MAGKKQRRARRTASATNDALAVARRRYGERAWADAFAAFSQADAASPLGAADLELLANAAYLVGEDFAFLETLERAHGVYLAADEQECAARCAFWIGLTLLFMGEMGRGTGWLATARRLVDGKTPTHLVAGYLLLPAAEQMLDGDDFDGAYRVAADAVAMGERRRDPDLVSCALHLQGRAVIGRGQVEDGLVLLDEAMIAVTADRLSPIMTGLIYCSVIDACRQVYALARAWEWTSALNRWCEAQPQMAAFTGTCLVHRAEIMQLRGAWDDAIAEARRACARGSQGFAEHVPAAGFYQQAEVHRLRGEFDAADAAYRQASERGRDPQPGLALLRLAQGRGEIAAAAIRRAISSIKDGPKRAQLLPAYVEIMLAVGETESARQGAAELADIARRVDTEVIRAMAAGARGSVELAEGAGQAALASLRAAYEAWQKVKAPHEAARTRVLIALACRTFADEEGAELELRAAGAVFDRLGAAPDLARVKALMGAKAPERRHRLTPRELQVLRLVAAGMTNKAIADELRLSERTVDRHVANIFDKTGVSARAAATAYAYKHKLI